MSNNPIKKISRKRFLLWGTAVLSATGLIKFWNPIERKKPETAKFLTQDGKLVEVDKEHINSTGAIIYASELKEWIKK
jgi:hypothetical protein